MKGALKEMSEIVAEKIEKELLGESVAYTVAPDSNWGSGLTMDQLQKTIDLLTEHDGKPMPVAIWFIERPGHWQAFKFALPPSFTSPILGLPVYNYTSFEELLRDVKSSVEYPERDPNDGLHEWWEKCFNWACAATKKFPFVSPGIYVEMRNAPHIKIECTPEEIYESLKEMK